MATQLDLEEQEQLDQLKAFWKKYGNLITWVLVAVLGAYAAYAYWEKRGLEQSAKAGLLYDELDRAAQAGDLEKTLRVFGDMKERFPGTGFTQQAGLLTAKVQAEKAQADAAVATLGWVAENAGEAEYKTVARLRLAGLLLEQKKPDEALKQLAGADAPAFAALVADRRGDVLAAQGKTDEARAAYQEAFKAMDSRIEYRRMIEAKLITLGGTPEADAGKKATS
ncbi:YfgM family protein [Rhizobacter sp. LjRoot28]|uniref:YfgM family protein n=1 Tax=Rhizobacter sp. LjRoot28 TaxID=3342309 RepID=UPI003ED09734